MWLCELGISGPVLSYSHFEAIQGHRGHYVEAERNFTKKQFKLSFAGTLILDFTFPEQREDRFLYFVTTAKDTNTCSVGHSLLTSVQGTEQGSPC